MRVLSKKCVHCGKSFSGTFARGKDSWRKRKYCSVECKKAAQIGATWAPVFTKSCEQCGKKFSNRRANGRTLGQQYWAKARFCSNACKDAFSRGKPAWNKGLRENIEERFLRHVRKEENGCWKWMAQRNTKSEYGYFSADSLTKVLAHRASYTLFKGEIPEGPGFHGTCVCHTCDHPWCVNPDHLFLGTHYMNMRDKVAKGRQNHTRGSSHPLAKLNERDVKAIRMMCEAGLYSQREIGEKFGVSHATVSLILKGVNWRHVK